MGDKLRENIEKNPKDLWKSRKFSGLPKKQSTCHSILIKTNTELNLYYNFIANDLVRKFPQSPNKFGREVVKNITKILLLIQVVRLSIQPTTKTIILELFWKKQIHKKKYRKIDNSAWKYLKEGVLVLLDNIIMCNGHSTEIMVNIKD